MLSILTHIATLTIALGLFIALIKTDRRSLMFAALLLAFLVSLLFYLSIVFDITALSSHAGSIGLPVILFISLVALIALGPLLLIAVLIIEGILLIRRNGIRPKNLLSLLFGIYFIISNIFFVRIITQAAPPTAGQYIHLFLTICADYLLLLSSIYVVASCVNFVNLVHEDLKYIIVLGAGLINGQVSPILAGRIDRAITVYHRNPASQLIMSGGRGPDEPHPEAHAMKQYALQQGIPAEDIILEEHSSNTFENLKFSADLMTETNEIAIVTNYYHLLRALIIAKELGISCIGYGAHTKFYFSVNAFVREFIGYIVLRKKLYLSVLGGLILLFGAFVAYQQLWL